jgi:hypothetical protein
MCTWIKGVWNGRNWRWSLGLLLLVGWLVMMIQRQRVWEVGGVYGGREYIRE